MVLAWSRKSYLGPVQIMYICGGPIETVECIWEVVIIIKNGCGN